MRVRLRLPRDPNALHLVRAVTDPVLAAGGADADGRHDMAAALTEACGNAIRHAHTTDSYEVAVSVEDGLCTAEVIDQGVGFHHDGPPAQPPPNAASGRGLYLIAQLADWLEVDSFPGRGTTIRFVKRLTRPAAALHA
jgi:serine/threonine-protein kinase RsbW